VVPQKPKEHIMISYCWSQKETVDRIARDLKSRGYNIWLDSEKMEGSTLEAMARAVEGSYLILVCVSSQYKDSPNCRLEGEYLTQLHKPWLPLMMERHFKPTGWLGIMLGTKLHYAFSQDADFNTSMENLVKKLGDHGPAVEVPAPPPSHAGSPAAASSVPVSAWTHSDVSNWLAKLNLSKHIGNFSENEMDGPTLVLLGNIARKNEALALTLLESKLKVESLRDQLILLDRLQHLN